MLKQALSIHGVMLLAVLGVVGASCPARAQYYYQQFYRTNPPTLFPFETAIDAPETYGSYTQGPGFFYSGRIGDANTPEEQAAYIHVRVSPPHAEISFEGSKTAQIGSSRLYVSPPLVAGKNYTYTIRVSWKENGGEVSQTRQFGVRAGDRLSVVFRAPATAAPPATMQTTPAAQP
jgi:uncharacterized protein (TIGR03000 family)